jgi:hypothetical protein
MLFNTLFKFVFLFCVFVFYCVYFVLPYCFVNFFPFVNSCLFPIFAQVYRPLPPGGIPIAVNKYHIISYIVSYHISYHITSYHISYHIISYFKMRRNIMWYFCLGMTSSLKFWGTDRVIKHPVLQMMVHDNCLNEQLLSVTSIIRRLKIYIHTYIHTVSDRGVLIWPWQWFALGQPIFHWFLTANRFIPIINTLDWSAVVFCLCETKQLLAVVFCVVRAMPNLTLGLLQKKHLTNGEPVFVKCTELYSDREPRYLTGSVRFFREF